MCVGFFCILAKNTIMAKKTAPKPAAPSLESVKLKIDDVMADLDALAASAVYPQRFKNAKRQIQLICRNALKV